MVMRIIKSHEKNYSYLTRTLDKANFIMKVGKCVLLTINHVEINSGAAVQSVSLMLLWRCD